MAYLISKFEIAWYSLKSCYKFILNEVKNFWR